MAIAGFCRQCNQNVWCDVQGNCANGHPVSEVRDWYDPDTGERFDLTAPSTAPAAPQAAGTGAAVVTEIAQALLAKSGYTVTGGTNTDLVIGSEVANANWITGKKKVTYSAIMKAEESERTVYWWEMLQEGSGGLSFGTIGSESTSTFGAKRYGTKREVVIGPGGVAMDYSWDYAATRQLAEEIAARNGFAFKVVLRKKSAER
ncbi:MAG: hypothetical protein JXP37_04640 [Coriobacteriia bacterium]|nr:hypothetical protein [Coriobacteriia bacterium]